MKRNKGWQWLALSLLGVIFFQPAFSQENFLTGHLITMEGDTLPGFIDYRNWENNPDKISFKKTPEGEKTIYTPLDILGFKVLDEFYESAIVEKEVSPILTRDLDIDPAIKTRKDTTFLQTMIQGAKGLYHFKDDGKDQFYIKHESQFNLLVYKRYLLEHKGKTLAAERNNYLHQLKFYFQDCPSIQSALKDLAYNKKSMEKVFVFYHDCTQSEIKFQKKSEKVKLEIGALAGISIATVNFGGNDFLYLTNADFSSSINPSAGLFFDFILPRNLGKWSFYNEIIFTSFQIDGSYSDFEHENRYTNSYTEMEYAYLKLNSLARFKYPVGNLFVYINAGISNGFAISETNYLREESKFFTTERLEEGKALNETKRYERAYLDI